MSARTTPQVLHAATVVTGSAVLSPGWVSWSGDQILAVGEGTPPSVDHDLGDVVVVPGFVDMHVHGGGGGDFTAVYPQSAQRAVTAHRQHGTTSSLASLVSASARDLRRSVSMLAELVQDRILLGVHLEGPWISPGQCGAHDPATLREPDPADIEALMTSASGAIAMVTIAPELPGGIKAIKQVLSYGAVVAIGHTNATYDLTRHAIDAGATVATHLGNCMAPVHHRAPGPITALLEDPRVTVEVIADGVHVHPAIYRQISALAGPDRVALVTDAIAATGLGDGEFHLGAMEISVRAGVARLRGTDTIAGSTATMDRVFARAVVASSAAEPLLAAVQQTSTNPARTLGVSNVGAIATGYLADLAVLSSSSYDLTGVLSRGRWLKRIS